MAEVEDPRVKFDKLSNFIISQVSAHVNAIAGCFDRIVRYSNLLVPPLQVEQLPRHDLFVMLEKTIAAAAEAKFIEKQFTRANFSIAVNLKPVFPLAVDKFDKVLDIFMEKFWDSLEHIEEVIVGLNDWCAWMQLIAAPPDAPVAVSRKEFLVGLIEKCRRIDANLSRLELFVMKAYASPPAELVAEFLKLKKLFDSGFLSDTEFDDRRVQVIERMIVANSGLPFLTPPRPQKPGGTGNEFDNAAPGMVPAGAMLNKYKDNTPQQKWDGTLRVGGKGDVTNTAPSAPSSFGVLGGAGAPSGGVYGGGTPPVAIRSVSPARSPQPQPYTAAPVNTLSPAYATQTRSASPGRMPDPQPASPAATVRLTTLSQTVPTVAPPQRTSFEGSAAAAPPPVASRASADSARPAPAPSDAAPSKPQPATIGRSADPKKLHMTMLPQKPVYDNKTGRLLTQYEVAMKREEERLAAEQKAAEAAAAAIAAAPVITAQPTASNSNTLSASSAAKGGQRSSVFIDSSGKVVPEILVALRNPGATTAQPPPAAPPKSSSPAPPVVITTQPSDEELWFKTQRGPQTSPVPPPAAASNTYPTNRPAQSNPSPSPSPQGSLRTPAAAPSTSSSASSNRSSAAGETAGGGEDLWFNSIRGQTGATAAGVVPALDKPLSQLDSAPPEKHSPRGTHLLHAASPTPTGSSVIEDIFRPAQDVAISRTSRDSAMIEKKDFDVGEVTGTKMLNKKPLNMKLVALKSATPGQKLSLAVTVDNGTKTKINCLQIILLNAQRKEVETQAVFPIGFPLAQTSWTGNVSYQIPSAAPKETHYICVEAMTKEKDNLRLQHPIMIQDQSRGWSDNPTQIFETPLADAIKRDKSDVPRIVTASIAQLLRMGVADCEGLFRVPGSAERIASVRAEVDAGRYYELDTLDAHTVAGLLKLYIRSLPEPLLTFPLYETWIAAGEIPDAEFRITKFKDAMSKLPECNRALTGHFLKFLSHVSSYGDRNKMSAENLAIIFAPVLIRRKDRDVVADVPKVSRAMKMLIIDANELFPEVRLGN